MIFQPKHQTLIIVERQITSPLLPLLWKGGRRKQAIKAQEEREDHQPTKGLLPEKKRLKKDLADLQTEVEDLTPTTPTGTVDWYVKWTSMSFAVLGVFLISAGLVFW